MHTYACAECGERFQSETHATRCPKCRCKVLIHVDGEPKKGGSCAGGCGGSCASCGGHCH